MSEAEPSLRAVDPWARAGGRGCGPHYLPLFVSAAALRPRPSHGDGPRLQSFVLHVRGCHLRGQSVDAAVFTICISLCRSSIELQVPTSLRSPTRPRAFWSPPKAGPSSFITVQGYSSLRRQQQSKQKSSAPCAPVTLAAGEAGDAAIEAATKFLQLPVEVARPW